MSQEIITSSANARIKKMVERIIPHFKTGKKIIWFMIIRSRSTSTFKPVVPFTLKFL